MVGPDHELVLSGDVMWCFTCGCYADAKSKGLSYQCRGNPKWSGNYGGAWGQIRKLRAGIHPRGGRLLEDPIGLDGRSIGEITKASGTYSNLPAYRKEAADGERRPPHEQLHSQAGPPTILKDRREPQGKTAEQKRQAMLQRVRAKEKAAANQEDDPQPAGSTRSEGRPVGREAGNKHRRESSEDSSGTKRSKRDPKFPTLPA